MDYNGLQVRTCTTGQDQATGGPYSSIIWYYPLDRSRAPLDPLHACRVVLAVIGVVAVVE